ncbi:gamma-aminobutyric acid type B receptor subunit 2-like [Physella acuta]|uniref:gamma-aminobutyric acid type B receptor subunit 2-like n=1 Tax=Physella acuta TaxID=109671 RepID=UPI0027DD0B7A|nr:gamma-aminobutyric acid type B receptor subunit 2-like [Physella acuta]
MECCTLCTLLLSLLVNGYLSGALCQMDGQGAGDVTRPDTSGTVALNRGQTDQGQTLAGYSPITMNSTPAKSKNTVYQGIDVKIHRNLLLAMHKGYNSKLRIKRDNSPSIFDMTSTGSVLSPHTTSNSGSSTSTVTSLPVETPNTNLKSSSDMQTLQFTKSPEEVTFSADKVPISGPNSSGYASEKSPKLPDSASVESPKILHIGGLFELSGKDGPSGRSELDAALLAIDHVNKMDIIPGYQLTLLYNDSKCDPGFGTDAFFDFVYRKSNESSLVMVMGSACTEVTKTLAEIVPYWNLVLISYAATSPALSEREKYRTFFRLALGDSALNPARRMLVQHNKWDKMAALYEEHESLSLAFNEMNKDFSAHDIVIKSSTSFKDARLEVPGQLKEIMDMDVRIIIGGFTEAAARQVFCQAYKLGMYQPRYVWIMVGWLKELWWRDVHDTNCTKDEMAVAVEGAFTIVSLNGLMADGKSVANLTTSEFVSAYYKANGSLPMSIFAACTYDTVWTMALTLRQATEEWAKNGTAPLLHQLSYDRMADVKETFISTMENLEFPGVSGPVSFKGSDREGISAVYQVQGGNLTQVAIHLPSSTHLDFDCDSCHKILWQGKSYGRTPKDELVIVARPKTIEVAVFYTCAGLCTVGLIMAVSFLTYNLHHRRLKFIKLSSPKLNNVATIGCILVYTAVIMLGLDDRTLTDSVFPIICSVRAFLLAAGFSLAFGAMFAKTFRVHQIFTRAHHGLVKSKLIQDTHLLVIIGVLLAVDSSVVLVWVVVDPMSRHVTNTTKEVSPDDEDLIFQEQLTTCHSNHLQKWLGAFYAYKGLLLIFGVYMAWETRHVKIPALNDSQYIGLNVYNVVIMSVCVVVISNILSNQPTLAYAMEASFMFLSTTVTLCLLFVPKIYAIVTSGGNPVIACTGILVDNTNTRRFVFDDRKEIYYRAEVQNRVYKRELVELDQNLARLERLLEMPLVPCTKLTDQLLYLLPESKIDGTPCGQRRYRREFDRCSSISDGGEGVMYEETEDDDILTDMGFGPPFDSSKQQRPTNAEKSGSKTLNKLGRSLSIGSGNRPHKRRKPREIRKISGSLRIEVVDEDSNSTSNNDDTQSQYGSSHLETGSATLCSSPSRTPAEVCLEQAKTTKAESRPSVSELRTVRCGSDFDIWLEKHQRLSDLRTNGNSPSKIRKTLRNESRQHVIDKVEPDQSSSSKHFVPSQPNPSLQQPPAANPTCLEHYVTHTQATDTANHPSDDNSRNDSYRSFLTPTQANDHSRGHNSENHQNFQLSPVPITHSTGSPMHKPKDYSSTQTSLNRNINEKTSDLIHFSDSRQTSIKKNVKRTSHFQEIPSQPGNEHVTTGNLPDKLTPATLKKPNAPNKKQRIKKLEDDLLKIQQELDDLKGQPCGTSEL